VNTHPPSAETISFEVRRIVAEVLRAPVESVSLDDSLDESRLALDSLALIKLNVLLEEQFDITLPDFGAEGERAPRRVRDLVSVVVAGVGGAR
jgi:acyl carrier protein